MTNELLYGRSNNFSLAADIHISSIQNIEE